MPQSFVVTAYYSPVQGQQFYWQGSYSAEIALNGNGTHGASGKEVFNGMIAAPQNIPFGSMIVLNGRGTGLVHDRGGAIVQSGSTSGMRIDIWVGTGELGLMRALSFGRRTLSGCIDTTVSSTGSLLGFARDRIPFYTYFFEVTLTQQRLELGRKDPWVGVLLLYLRQLGYQSLPLGMEFNESLKKTICAIQVEQGFVTADDPLCGIAGTRTLSRIVQQMKQQKRIRSDLFKTL